ncbi:hypothetical protein HXX76_004496 [Chlamydomonas incerta]|uniref:SAP domain-containing protein n=1 Tax=Chlamydomonas incerta TaxID=51695 RepID=A0A835TEZ4_CHLIN|nr:hypothetical protein HXX76_004496 [Chlamydomonas incerta]|eukprot:KAG2439129.1 hypothetical protein HXX76_004496 [Chlamydomonas incerta]
MGGAKRGRGPESGDGAAEAPGGANEAKPALETPRRSERAKQKVPWNQRICQSHAMERYGLARWELDALTDMKLKPNPYYKSAAPMRLYLQREVKAIYEKKQEHLKYEADHAEEFAAAREEAARQRREAAKEAALAKEAPLKRPSAGESVPAGNTPLPQELWAVVFQRLAATLEPQGGVRDPGVVAADIVGAGLACRDMFIASRAGLEALAEEVEAKRPLGMLTAPIPALVNAGAGAGVDWARWDKLLRTPLSCAMTELKAACKEMGEMVSGTKAELVVRLMAHFGLPDGRRCPVPARLWVALRQEHNWRPYGSADARNKLICDAQITTALRELSEAGHSVANTALCCTLQPLFRCLLSQAYGDTADRLAAHRAIVPQLGEIRVECARRAQEERLRLAEEMRRTYESGGRQARALPASWLMAA